nr:rhodanese-like domain-containing protein [Agromyces protaetiae]
MRRPLRHFGSAAPSQLAQPRRTGATATHEPGTEQDADEPGDLAGHADTDDHTTAPRHFGSPAPSQLAQPRRTGATATHEPGTEQDADEPGANADPAAAISWIDVVTLRERLRRRQAGTDRFTLVDVREPDEYGAGAIPGSVLLPLGEVLRDPAGVRAELAAAGAADADTDADAAIVVHCQTDRRSERAALALARIGEPVTVVRGGYLAWSDLEPVAADPAGISEAEPS